VTEDGRQSQTLDEWLPERKIGLGCVTSSWGGRAELQDTARYGKKKERQLCWDLRREIGEPTFYLSLYIKLTFFARTTRDNERR